MSKVLWIIVLATCGLYICGQVVDPDLWWHITVGRWILSHSALPESDQWTMFAYGQPWRAYSWLFEILVASIDRSFGVHGLWLLKLVIAFSLAGTLGFVYSRLSQNYFVGAFLGVIATAACFNHFTLRPQSVVWILFACLLYQAAQIGERGISRGVILRIFLILSIWANIHITTLLGLGALFLWVYGSRGIRDAATVVFVGFIATLITPYVGGEWLTFFDTTSHPFQYSSIAEFQPATILQHSTAFLLILVSVVLLLIYYDKKRIDPAKHFMWMGFTVAGLAVVKFLPFACITLATVIAYGIGMSPEGLKSLGNFGEAVDRLRKLIGAIPREGLSFLLICWFVVLFMDVWREPLNKRITPVDIFDQIESKKLQAPVLVGFGTGGYMMYRFSNQSGVIEDPSRRPPIDGRTNLISKDLWDKFQKSFHGREGWNDFVAQVNPNTIVWKSESPLNQLLVTSGSWCQVLKSGNDTNQGYTLLIKREILNNMKESFPQARCSN